MPLRMLNDYVLVVPEENHFVCENPEVTRILNEGTILAPEENSLTNKANSGIVISYGPKCHYKFRHGQKVYFPQWVKPSYYFDGGIRYRFFCEHELNAVEE